jgi:hypothetical protein
MAQKIGESSLNPRVRIAGIDLDGTEAAFLYSGLGVLAGAAPYPTWPAAIERERERWP